MARSELRDLAGRKRHTHTAPYEEETTHTAPYEEVIRQSITLLMPGILTIH